MQDLYQEETDRAAARMPALVGPDVGVWDGFARGTAQTAMMNFAKAGRSAHLLGAISPYYMDYFTGGTEAQERYFKTHDEYFQEAVDFWTPDPDDVGVAAQIAGTLLSIIPMMLANPAAAASALGIGVSEDLAKAGVSIPKAMAVGASEGILTYAGMKAPIFGKTLAQRVFAGGIGFNVAQGTAMRASADAILEGTVAEDWFDTFDTTELWMDIIMGGVFGGIVHVTPRGRAESAQAWKKLEVMLGRNTKQLDRDAIAILRQEAHKRVDSMPGKPLDDSDVVAHVNRAERAINLLMADQVVAVDDLPAPRVVPDPVREAEAVRNIETLGESAEDIRQSEGLPKEQFLVPVESELPTRRESDIVNPIDRNAPTEEKVRQMVELSKENDPIVTDFLRQLDEEIGSESKTNFKAPENIASKANRPSVKAKKPWFDVEHVRDAFRFKSVIDDMETSMPKIAELVKEKGWGIVKIDTGKLTSPLEWGWRFVALDLRMPNGQIVEYQIIPRELEVRKDANHLLFENWRNRKLNELAPEEEIAFQRDLLASREAYGEAWNGYLSRTGSTEDALRASSSQFAASLGSVTGAKSVASSSTVGIASRPIQTPESNIPKTSGAESTITRVPSSDLETTGSIRDTSEGIIPQDQAGLTDPEAPAVTGDDIFPPPRGAAREAGAEGSRVDVTPLEFAAERFATENPDLPIRIGTDTDGNAITTTAKEMLEDAYESAARAREDMSLFEAAAACLLGGK